MSIIKHLVENWAIQVVDKKVILFHLCFDDRMHQSVIDKNKHKDKCPTCLAPVPEEVQTLALLLGFGT